MARILILWNQIGDDLTELWRADGRRTLDWDPSKVVDAGDTVEEEMRLLETAVRDAGHRVSTFNIADDVDQLLAAIARERPDAVMNLVEFFHDDFAHEHHVAAVFELLGVPYTGARPQALALCQNKAHAKALLVAAGLPTPRGVVVDVGGAVPRELPLRFPMIVKPAYEDASGGIDAGSVVADRAALEARVAHVLAEHAMPAIVEEYIAGRELHCAIVGNDPPEALPLFEMVFADAVDDHGRPLPKIITYRAKWDPFSRDFYAVDSRCPPLDLEPEVVAYVQGVAVRAYRALGCRDYARVDMRLDEATGEPYVLEVNPNPDLAKGDAFAQCVRASGRTYGRAVAEIVGFAVARGEAAKAVGGAREPSDDLLREYLAKRG
jgi:D-alanine-D-alanine ligase